MTWHSTGIGDIGGGVYVQPQLPYVRNSFLDPDVRVDPRPINLKLYQCLTHEIADEGGDQDFGSEIEEKAAPAKKRQT